MPDYGVVEFAKRNKLGCLSQVELAWLAGLFEGEGHVGLTYNSSNANYMKAGITQKGEFTARLLEAMTGLGYSGLQRESGCWRWNVSCRGARAFLVAIRPFMKLPHKIAQVEEAMEKDLAAHKRNFVVKNYKYIEPSGRWKYRPLPYELRII